MPPMQPYQIVVEVTPDIRPVDASDLARHLQASMAWSTAADPPEMGALMHAVDQAIKVFGLVKAFHEESERKVNGFRTEEGAGFVQANCWCPNGEDGHIYSPLTAGCPDLGPVLEADRTIIRAQEEPTCFCFGHGDLEGPHVWRTGTGCPITHPTSRDDRWRVVTNLLASASCWCRAHSSDGGRPSDPHLWSPTGYCPSWAPTAGQPESLPEAWSRDWYGYLEKRLAQVFNAANVDGALDRPDWEIARRLMVEVAKMRRETKRDPPGP